MTSVRDKIEQKDSHAGKELLDREKAIMHAGAYLSVNYSEADNEIFMYMDGRLGPMPGDSIAREVCHGPKMDNLANHIQKFRQAICNLVAELQSNIKKKSKKRQHKKKKKKTSAQLLKDTREHMAEKLLKEGDYTAEELGAKLGCHKSTVSRLTAWKKYMQRLKSKTRKEPNGYKRSRSTEGPDIESTGHGPQVEHYDIKQMIDEYSNGKSPLPTTKAIKDKLSLDNEKDAERLYRETLHHFPELEINTTQ